MPIWGRACKWRPNLLTVSCKTCIAILYQRCSNLFMSRSSLQKCIPYLASNLHLEILCIYNIVIYSKIFKKVHNLSKYKYTFSFSYWYFTWIVSMCSSLSPPFSSIILRTRLSCKPFPLHELYVIILMHCQSWCFDWLIEILNTKTVYYGLHALLLFAIWVHHFQFIRTFRDVQNVIYLWFISRHYSEESED